MKKFREILLLIPTTKLRILTSIILSVFIVIVTVFRTYEPTWEILAFLLVQQGLDISQYAVKRNHINEAVDLEQLPKETTEQSIEEKQSSKE